MLRVVSLRSRVCAALSDVHLSISCKKSRVRRGARLRFDVRVRNNPVRGRVGVLRRRVRVSLVGGVSLSGGLRNGCICGVHFEIFDRFTISY